MALTRSDVLRQAIDILNTYGLGDLTMRRLAGSLSVQASALYWHFANKQELLAAVAARILEDVELPGQEATWAEALEGWAMSLHEVLLSYRDGAELTASALSLRLGTLRPQEPLAARLAASGMMPPDAEQVATIVLHQTIGLTLNQQSQAQAVALGVLQGPAPDDSAQLRLALELLAAGIAARFELSVS